MTIIFGEKRIKFGKSISKRLRNIDNKIPGIIYGNNHPTLYISLNHEIILNLLDKKNFFSDDITIIVLQKKYLVRLQSIQKHCFKKKILHIDFLYK
ncbi:50S ribosomal protein L25 [Buchnera aphidicola]|uniref:50S ribosomal protein L25 n=1 Tax=Buchnera aphidicola TaxID=9 RepID=UPI0031B84C7C